MMPLPFRQVSLAVAITGAVIGLSGCGQGSDNLDDPVKDIVSECTGDQCVPGQFLDEPVAGLNYRCDNVESMTSATGEFKCPNNSVVTFYLKAKDGKREVVLGSTKIARIVSVTGYNPVKLLQITPRDLVDSGLSIDDLFSVDNKSVHVLNIIRFLQAMGDPADVFPNGSGRINLTDERKKAIDVLETDFLSNLFSNSNFDDLIAPVLAKVGSSGTTLPAATDAVARFKSGFILTQSGVYEASPQVFSGFVDLEKLALQEVGVVGQWGPTRTESNVKVADRALEGFLLMLDREGKSLGFGLEWLNTTRSSSEDPAVPLSVSDMLYKSAPRDLALTGDSVGFELSGLLKPDFSFKVGTVGTGENLGKVTLTSGMMEHGFILSHPVFYRNLFGLSDSEPVPDTKIGKWKRTTASGETTYTGGATLQRFRTLDPYLDPAIWKTIDTVQSGTKPIFPLHLTLNLRNNNTAGGCGAGGCPAGRLDITILANGNIVSDVNQDCSPLTSDGSMKDTSGQQEYRLGAVSALIREATVDYLSPVILVPFIPGWESLYGTQIGMTSSAGGKKVKISLSSIPNRFVSILDNEAENSEAPAEWVNYINYYRYSQKYPVDLTSRIPEAQGKVTSIGLQTCYNPLPKP